MDAPTNHITVTHDRQTLWSLLAGALIWFLHLNVVYPLTSLACKWGWFPSQILGMPGLRFVQVVLTVLAGLLIVITIYVPWRNWRYYQTQPEKMPHQTESNRRPFAAFVTMSLNTFFLIFVVASFAPILALNPCR